MFDIGWSELLIIGVVTLIVVGPKELPVFLRTLGRYVGAIKKQAGEFRAHFDDAMRASELRELQDEMRDLQHEVTDTFSPPDVMTSASGAATSPKPPAQENIQDGSDNEGASDDAAKTSDAKAAGQGGV